MANSRRRNVEFQAGEWVFLKLQPYHQQTTFKIAFQKLACRFYGPYQIEQKVGQIAYKLKLPERSRIHPVFHVSLLKKKLGDSILTTNKLPATNQDGNILLQLEMLLETCCVKKGLEFVEKTFKNCMRSLSI